tara:strand:+ start:18827 stop:18973 length:147 start_codon:yes stop_codon:yes gene_type:complete
LEFVAAALVVAVDFQHSMAAERQPRLPPLLLRPFADKTEPHLLEARQA